MLLWAESPALTNEVVGEVDNRLRKGNLSKRTDSKPIRANREGNSCDLEGNCRLRDVVLTSATRDWRKIEQITVVVDNLQTSPLRSVWNRKAMCECIAHVCIGLMCPARHCGDEILKREGKGVLTVELTSETTDGKILLPCCAGSVTKDNGSSDITVAAPLTCIFRNPRAPLGLTVMALIKPPRSSVDGAVVFPTPAPALATSVSQCRNICSWSCRTQKELTYTRHIPCLFMRCPSI